MIRRTLSVLGLVALLASACASPTLPLPPPAQPTISITGAGTVHLFARRGVESNALVVIVNRNPNVPLDRRVGGAQADGEGTWDADVSASRGDVLEITQEFGATKSPPIQFQIP